MMQHPFAMFDEANIPKFIAADAEKDIQQQPLKQKNVQFSKLQKVFTTSDVTSYSACYNEDVQP